MKSVMSPKRSWPTPGAVMPEASMQYDEIIIVDYDVGNAASVLNMFSYLGYPARLSAAPADVSRAARIILPGVGSFDAAMNNLRASRLDAAIVAAAASGAYVFGVCLGMQLLGRASEEGVTEGLGLIDGVSRRIMPTSPTIKVPNMGWRMADPCRAHWAAIADARYYFANSYHFCCDHDADIVATVD